MSFILRMAGASCCPFCYWYVCLFVRVNTTHDVPLAKRIHVSYSFLGGNESTSSPNHLHNWAYSYEFEASKIVKPTSIDQVAAIVRDVKKYPSPVRALGSIHSVTECVVSNGTIIDIRGPYIVSSNAIML